MVDKILKCGRILGDYVGSWDKRYKELGKAILSASLCLALMACVASDRSVSEHSETVPENFTTEGKPTKTIETPWGPKEIYDPSQDLEFREALDSVYKRGNATFGDVSRFNGAMSQDPEYLSRHGFPVGLTTSAQPPDVVKLRLARKTQYYDMLRMGCKIIEEVPKQYYGRQHFTKSCLGDQLGRHHLSDCEIDNLVTVTEIQNPDSVEVPNAQIAKGRWQVFGSTESRYDQGTVSSSKAYYTAYASPLNLNGLEYNIQNVFFIGAQSGLSEQESLTLLTLMRCKIWHDDNFFKGNNTGE